MSDSVYTELNAQNKSKFIKNLFICTADFFFKLLWGTL